MGNLSTREKFLMLFIVLLVVIAGLYFGIYKPQLNKKETLQARYNELNQQKTYYDQMIQDTAANELIRDSLNDEIEDVEATFIPRLNTEAIENWVLKKFEDANCPFLVNVEVADVTQPGIVLPDGSTSPCYLLLKSVTVTYVTTDGINVTQYNGNPEIADWAPSRYYTTLSDNLNEFGNVREGESVIAEPLYPVYGYDEFLDALDSIASTDPQAIKVNSFSAADTAGHLVLTATIDFYSANMPRISEADMSDPYVTFSGDTPATGVGLIGLPLYPVNNSASDWNGRGALAASAEMPYAANYSRAIFSYICQSNDLNAVLGYTEDYMISFTEETNDAPAGEVDEADQGEVA